MLPPREIAVSAQWPALGGLGGAGFRLVAPLGRVSDRIRRHDAAFGQVYARRRSVPRSGARLPLVEHPSRDPACSDAGDGHGSSVAGLERSDRPADPDRAGRRSRRKPARPRIATCQSDPSAPTGGRTGSPAGQLMTDLRRHVVRIAEPLGGRCCA